MSKISSLAALALALILCDVVMAQLETSYVIQTKFVTNLRAAPSLESSIVAKAKAGETLNVIDEADGWLRIAWGADEAWMAGWVDHTVITKEGPFEITSRFADMSCERGIDWWEDKKGVIFYWTDMGCALELRPHESVLPAHMKEIAVEGPRTIVFKVNLALKTLKERAPAWYGYVADAVDKIIGYNEGSSLDVVFGIAYVYPHLPNMYISIHATGTIPALIGAIIHEACHIYQFRANLQLVGAEDEIMCHSIELYALEDVGYSTSTPEAWIRQFLIYGE